MYRFNKNGQLDIYDFILPFGGHLDEENRWVRLRKMIDWDAINEEYSKQFENKGATRHAAGRSGSLTAIGGCTVLPVVKRQNPGHTGKPHATDSLTSTRGAPNPPKKSVMS